MSIEPMYELRSFGRLARQRARLMVVLVLALYVFGVHELFHFTDWLSWGLRYDGLRNVATTLTPYFGQHDILSYVVHAVVNVVVLTALAYAFVVAYRSLPDRRDRSTELLLVEGEGIEVLGPWRTDLPPERRNGSGSSEERRPES